jgi:hypothetical protein
MRGWVVGGALLLLGSAAAAQTVHSLDQVPGALSTPEGKGVFAQQMAGAPAPDLLGLKLPAGMTASTVAALLRPAGDAAPLNTVGVKPLPGEAGLYVAVVCTGGDVPSKPDDDHCTAYSGGDAVASLKVYVGLLRMQPGAAPTLAALPVAVDRRVDWRHTDLADAPEALDDASGDLIAATGFSALDLAPYVIAPGVRAFGLRGKWDDGYSGGLAEYQALYLFGVKDGALRQVFAAPMSEYRDVAGEWHADQTRDHEITDLADLLIVTPKITNGYFDLHLKRRGGKETALFQWSAGSYQRVGK